MPIKIDIDKNKEDIINLLSTINRPGIAKLIIYLEESDFFIAPASKKYHLAVPGGLAQHGLCVYNTFAHLCERYYPYKVPVDSQIICGTLHDIGPKVNRYRPYTSPHKAAPDYEYNPDDFPIGHGEKSVIVLQKYIKLTDQEIVMIRWHMGPYSEGLKQYSFAVQEKFPEAYLLYFADHISTIFVETGKC